MTQRDLRSRNFPLLERIERMNQKEQEFESKEVEVPLGKIGKDLLSDYEVSNKLPKVKPLFTKLALLNNKRRYR